MPLAPERPVLVSRAPKLAVWMVWALLLAPVPLRAQPPPALPSHAVIRIASASEGGKHPVILLLHGRGGYPAGKDIYDRYAHTFASHGYDVYAVQYYDATDERIMESSDRSARQDRFRRRLRAWVATVSGVIDYMARQPTTDARKIGLIGFSNGAFLAIGAGGLDRRVGAVVELYGAMPSSLSSVITRLPPTLILHGDADRVIGVENAYALERFLQQR